MIVKTQRAELSGHLTGALCRSFHSVSNAARELSIPINRLRPACNGDLDRLRVEDLKKIAPYLPTEWRDDLREYALP